MPVMYRIKDYIILLETLPFYIVMMYNINIVK